MRRRGMNGLGASPAEHRRMRDNAFKEAASLLFWAPSFESRVEAIAALATARAEARHMPASDLEPTFYMWVETLESQAKAELRAAAQSLCKRKARKGR